MKFLFRKKSKDESKEPAETVESAANDTVQEQSEEAVVDFAEQAKEIRELLGYISSEEKPNVQDAQLFERAFNKAAQAVLTEPELATKETVQAFVDYAGKVDHAELRHDGVSRLGAIAVQYSEYGDMAIDTLTAALTDRDEEVRHSAVFSLRELAEANTDNADAIVETLTKATESNYRDVREDAILGLTSLAVKDDKYASGVVETLTGLISDPSEGVNGQQFYRVRIKSARQLGVVGLANETELDNVLTALETGLQDKDIFVRFRTIESLTELAEKYEDKKDRIVDSLNASKETAVFTVNEKIKATVLALKPPPEPVKTAEEIAADQKREKEAQKAAEEATKKRQQEERAKLDAEQQKKDRLDTVKRLANKLPGKKL